jgi:gp32 DNA binding protein like
MVNRRVGSLRKDHDRGGKQGGFFSHYRPPPADHVKRQAERKGGKFDSIFKGNFDTFTPKEGDNTIRILPAGWESHTDYAYPVWIHWGVGADESAYLCLRKMKGETCPICQEVARMKADGEGEDAKRIDCKERFICWIIDRTDRDETPMLYSMPAGTYKDINALCYSSKSGKAIFVDNPDDGYDVIIRRTGTKINTKYLPQVDREATAVTDDPDKYKELESWVQDNQIPDCLQFFDADYLERALSGEIDRNKEDDDDRPRRGRARDQEEDEADEDDRRPSGRRRPAVRDEDENEPPARTGRGKARGDDDLDDELPFDEGDDPEDESANEAREARQDRQARGRGRGRDDADDEDESEDRPRGNKARSRRDESNDEDEPTPNRGRARDEADDDEEEDDRPRQRTRVRDDRGGRSSGNRRI